MGGIFDHLHRVLTLLRVERGLQQNERAARAGVARAAMSRYETGKAKPTIDNLGKILEALQVDPVEFGEAVQRVRRRVDEGVEPPSRRLPRRSKSAGPQGAYLVLDLADFPVEGNLESIRGAVSAARHTAHQMRGGPGNGKGEESVHSGDAAGAGAAG